MNSAVGDEEYEIGPVETVEDRAALFALRMAVFVEEQNVPPEEELDVYDVTATHFLVRARRKGADAPGTIVGTARLLDKGDGVGKIGRVAVQAEYRGLGLGAALMRAMHAYASRQGYRRIILEAQCYAIPFYEKLGYIAEGDVFLDANIEHRKMWLTLQAGADAASILPEKAASVPAEGS